MINTLYLLCGQTRNYSVYKCHLNLNYIYALTLRRILIKAKFTCLAESLKNGGFVTQHSV